jgi:hypothetical protein
MGYQERFTNRSMIGFLGLSHALVVVDNTRVFLYFGEVSGKTYL